MINGTAAGMVPAVRLQEKWFPVNREMLRLGDRLFCIAPMLMEQEDGSLIWLDEMDAGEEKEQAAEEAESPAGTGEEAGAASGGGNSGTKRKWTRRPKKNYEVDNPPTFTLVKLPGGAGLLEPLEDAPGAADLAARSEILQQDFEGWFTVSGTLKSVEYFAGSDFVICTVDLDCMVPVCRRSGILEMVHRVVRRSELEVDTDPERLKRTMEQMSVDIGELLTA